MKTLTTWITPILLPVTLLPVTLFLGLGAFLLVEAPLMAADVHEKIHEKIDTHLAASLAASGQTDALIVLAEQADLSDAAQLHGKRARGSFVYQALRATAEQTQGSVLQELSARGLPVQRFWIVNMVATRLDAETAAVLAARPEVARLTVNAAIRAELPELEVLRSNLQDTLQDPLERKAGACPPTVEPSLLQIQADDFWDAGFDGRTVVIAGQDTGYDWDHPALRDAYRGWDGASASHDYHWHDAIHSGGGICGPDSPEPCDDFGHGTHTMGTMVGDAPGVRVGVAPGAQWIGCRNMDQGNGTVATYSECFEWFVAPTRLDGTAPDPSKAPHIVNNSWSCPPSEGCGDPEILQTVVENVRAAGILVVTSAGNSGSSCGSVSTPTAIYDASLTVGSVNSSDSIASSSSRGPVDVDGSGRLKPDLSAPGVSICSTTPGTGYGNSSGTSMAAPHVAGMAALVIAAAPCWEGDIDALEQHLTGNTSPRTSGQTCGGVPGTQIPNNTYGHGSLRGVLPVACLPLFVDGFESRDTSFWTAQTAH